MVIYNSKYAFAYVRVKMRMNITALCIEDI